MQQLSTKDFTFYKGAFVAEVSDLGGHLPTDPIYPDAFDVGFQMMSEKTGKVATFYFAREHRDGEGGITHWTYLPTSETVKALGISPETRVEIFND